MHAVVVAAVLASLTLTAATEPRRLTVDETVQQALEASTALRAARERAAAAGNQVLSHRGRMLPSVYLSDEQQHFNAAFDISLAPPGTPHPPILTARNINTNTFVAAANQPLLGLVRMGFDQSALGDTEKAALSEVRSVEAMVREEVQTLMLRLFEARALIGIAQASQRQLAEQLQVSRDKFAAGVLTRADVLRLEVAVANAKQQEIQASASEQIARSSLLADLGLPPDAAVDFVEPQTAEVAAESPGELPPLVERALRQRPEIVSATRLESASRSTSTARTLDLLPELNLEAGYTAIHGQVFAPPEASFVGLKAEWPIWTWGATYYQGRAAAHQANAAAAQAEDARRRVELDVASRLSNERAAASALDAGRAAIASAEEAFRVTTALVNVGSANTTDLLDAQAALTQARLNFARARYAYATARIGLARALGEL